jgi:hypothetical protein
MHSEDGVSLDVKKRKFQFIGLWEVVALVFMIFTIGWIIIH